MMLLFVVIGHLSLSLSHSDLLDDGEILLLGVVFVVRSGFVLVVFVESS